ncbi:MAG TPA: energy transducer TonB [Myxococcota bacterium]|jgi:TonB family protein
MTQQLHIFHRRKRSTTMGVARMGAAFEKAATQRVAYEFPGLTLKDPESARRTLLTGGLATLVHVGAVAILLILASLAPVIEEAIIPVQILKEEPPPPKEEPESAPAPKALAERRSVDYAPAVQAVQPQIVNPRVVAEASPAVSAEVLQMDAVGSVVAPKQINRAATVVERVSAVNSVVAARASAVDVGSASGPVVRGPIRPGLPVGPSAGPRQVNVAAGGTSTGTGRLTIGSGSSVREGVVSNRDVVGSPNGEPLASVDTKVGEGMLRGSGGTGESVVSETACFQKPEVQAYLSQVQSRTLERWVLPPSVSADQQVTLRFKLDVAGSASNVSLVRASDNALGLSAVDALRSASPFPAMPDSARCLMRVPITATFSNPVAG